MAPTYLPSEGEASAGLSIGVLPWVFVGIAAMVASAAAATVARRRVNRNDPVRALEMMVCAPRELRIKGRRRLEGVRF